jgi:hypothetical protein
LLISVRSAEEAETAIRGGADVIDIKDPTRGPLGMPPPQIVGAVLERVAGRRTVSLALGELNEFPAAAHAGLAFIKVGLAAASPDWRVRLLDYIDAFRPARLIAAAYADARRVAAPAPADVADWACQHKAAGLLIDTAVKDGCDLFHWLDEAQLASIITQVQSSGLTVALAGSLCGASVERALLLRPDIIAVRGAACGGDRRDGTVDQLRVERLAEVLAARKEQITGCSG